MWIRKPALRNVPVARFNRRGFRRNGSKSTTGRVGRRVAVRLWDCTSQSRQARARSEGKNRLFDSEINLYRLFGTIYCRLRRYPVGGAHCAPRQRKIIRFVGEHSDSLRAAYGGCSLDVHCGGCVRPYGSVGVDEFTSGVPRSYLRAPSLAALPQQSESTTGRAGRRVAMRPWAAITNHGRHAPNPKGRTDCSIAKSTCTGVCNDILPFATLSRLGAQCAPRQRKIIRFVGEHSDSLRAACGGCSLDAHCGGCVRPYGEVGVDEFTSGVPRSYPRAPSLAALPQFTLAHPTG